ncbi:hypothetical protein RclHR1_03350001 [Rhizophagus clarus]|uniref:Hsp70 family protein n=1 Tax=Rhizophagus clarus TaxID=94130 RepID=A0A2Z6R9Y4_9GLOM|nr:hypothetical protein RclHR1_03350001 [Rhizophagus clarus]
MTNECSNSEILFPADNNHEIVEKLEIGFKKLNNKFINLLEENQRIKQQYKNLQEENQEILRINSELGEKNKEISRTNLEILRKNSNLIEDYEKILRINNDLKEKLQEKDEQFEKLQQDLNLEKQKNKEIQRLEIISQNLEKNLKILEVDEIDVNTINAFKENNEQQNCNISNNPTPFVLNDDESLEENINKSQFYSKIRIIVGLDFGTTYSGFSYCHVGKNQEIFLNHTWPGHIMLKTNTVLRYDAEYNNVLSWGTSALYERPHRKNRKQKDSKFIELFKLCLGDLPDNLRPKLPIDCKKAITDYLNEMGKLIKNTICMRWYGVDYFENVLLIITIPADYSERDKVIMRQCVFNANLIESINSENLQFTTESEATALHCVENELKYDIGETFMFVDCGTYITDLTTRKLVRKDPLHMGKVTAHIRDFRGRSLIDDVFTNFLCERLGTRAIDLLKENNYNQFQYVVEDFRQRAIEPFTGDNLEFSYTLDIEDNIPALLQYISKETRKIMEEYDWSIDIKYNDIKKMFDTVADRIIRLMHIQLSNNKENCSTIFLTGEFCENKYLQNKIREEFRHKVNNISVPTHPIATIEHGAVIYGLSMLDDSKFKFDNLKFVTSSRVLKYTYGIQCNCEDDGNSLYMKTYGDKNCKFNTLVKRGTEVAIDQTFSFNFKPESNQSNKSFAIYYTQKYHVEYCGEPGVKLLGELNIDLPDVHLDNRSINFGLTFGQCEIIAFARNELNRQEHMITFHYPYDRNDDYLYDHYGDYDDYLFHNN